MSSIETLRASTTLSPEDNAKTDVLDVIRGLFDSIAWSNPDHDIDWSTVEISTEVDQVDEATIDEERRVVHEIKRLYVEVKGVNNA